MQREPYVFCHDDSRMSLNGEAMMPAQAAKQYDDEWWANYDRMQAQRWRKAAKEALQYDPHQASVIVAQKVDRLRPDCAEYVWKWDLGTVLWAVHCIPYSDLRRLGRYLSMPEQGCGEPQDVFEARQAKLAEWEAEWKVRQQEHEQYMSGLLGEGWRERAKQKRKEKERRERSFPRRI